MVVQALRKRGTLLCLARLYSSDRVPSHHLQGLLGKGSSTLFAIAVQTQVPPWFIRQGMASLAYIKHQLYCSMVTLDPKSIRFGVFSDIVCPKVWIGR